MNKSKFWVRSIPPISREETAANWTMQPLVQDYPGIMGNISTYYGTLNPGSLPHDIHAHDEEEIIVLLSGNLDIISPSSHFCMGAGSFCHYPPRTWHTIQATGSEPATFLLCKWGSQTESKTQFFGFDAHKLPNNNGKNGIQRQQIYQNRSAMLVVMANYIAPYTGYSLHRDAYDVMLILLRGEMHGLGHTNSAPAIIYYPEGTLHALAPKHQNAIEMLEFQFHQP